MFLGQFFIVLEVSQLENFLSLRGFFSQLEKIQLYLVDTIAALHYKGFNHGTVTTLLRNGASYYR